MQLAFSLAGAAIGSAFGGPVGAQVGWLLGSLIGSLLDPPKVEGPRRTDKKLQHSEYGSAIPVLWGTVRTAGNVIWQPAEMTEHKETTSGKGGPKTTTYTYSASFAVQLCAAKVFGEPALLGINKIWADGRLVCENGLPSDELPFVIYKGLEDQEPDPTIEADKGVDNVPAYRGIGMVVFTDLFLTDFGDRIPSLEFEVNASGRGTLDRISFFDDSLPAGNFTGSIQAIVGTYLDGNQLVLAAYEEDTPYSRYYENRYDVRTGALVEEGRVLDIDNPGGSSLVTWITSSNSNIAVGKIRGTGGTAFDAQWYRGGVEQGEFISPPLGEEAHTGAYFYAVYNRPYLYQDFIYAPGSWSGADSRVRIYKWGIRPSTNMPAGVAEDDFFDVSTHSVFHSPPMAGNNYVITFDDEGFLYVLGGGASSASCELFKVDPSDMTLVDQWVLFRLTDLRDPDSANIGTPSANINAGGFTVYRGLLALHGEGSVTAVAGTSAQLFVLTPSGSPSNLEWLDNCDLSAAWGGWNDLGGGYICNNDGIMRIGGRETLDQVVEDISVMAGFGTSDVDVTDLTDRVYGFRIASQMTAKNAIEALRQAYFFDGAEVDDQILFKHRNHASIFSIPDTDLAAHEAGGQAPPVLHLIRAPDHELPKRVNLTFSDPDLNYQPNTIYEERQEGSSTADVSLDLPLVFPTNIARSIASKHIFTALLEREQGTIWTSRKWEKLVPTDVITVQDRDYRVVAKRYKTPGIVEFDIVRTHPAVFEQTEAEASGISGGGSNASGGGGSSSSIGNAVSKLFLMDMPSLSQSDPPFGFRAGVCPIGTGKWRGAGIFKSYDGSNYTQIASTGTADVMGYTAASTGSPSVGGVLAVGSPATKLCVSLIDPTAELTSCSDTDFANGVNMFALQRSDGFWNICQFQYAELVTAGVYELSNITQHALDTLSIGLHAVGDAFIILPALVIDAPESDLNIAIYYKAVTYGATLGSAEAILFTNTGENATTYYGTVLQNLPVFSCDYGSPTSTRAGIVPAPTLAECIGNYILSVHGWIANTGGSGGGTIFAYDEGVLLGAIDSINVVGQGATATLEGSPQRLKIDIATMVVLAQAYSATTTIDLTNYQKYTRVVVNVGVLTGNIILNLTNGSDGQVIIVRLKQDATGGRIFTAGSNLRFSSSLPSPTLTATANKLDRLAFEWYDGPGSPSGYADLVAENLGY